MESLMMIGSRAETGVTEIEKKVIESRKRSFLGMDLAGNDEVGDIQSGNILNETEN